MSHLQKDRWRAEKSQTRSRSPRKRNGGTYLLPAGRERPTRSPASGQEPVWVSWAEAGSQIAVSGPWHEGGGLKPEGRDPMFTAGRNSQELRRPRSRPARRGYLHDSGTHTPTPLLPASSSSLQSAETSLSCSRRGLPGVGGGGGFCECCAGLPLNPGLHREARAGWRCPPPEPPRYAARPPSRFLPLFLHPPVWCQGD